MSIVKPIIKIEDLNKVDIRVGLIEKVENVTNSDKLTRLTMVNLEPKQTMGQVSQGMVFDIGYADGIIPVLAVPEKPVPNGSRAG